MRMARNMAITWLLAVAFTSVAVWSVGESPLTVLKVLGRSAFGSLDNISYTIFYATPLIFTGTSVALALEAGLFNLGGEGQLYLGAAAAAVWGVLTRSWWPDAHAWSPAWLVVVAGGALAAFAAGAFWGAVAGYLKTARKVHEVIATIMLNFIGMAFVNWLIVHPFKNPDTQNLETIPIGEQFHASPLWGQTTWGFPLALAIAVLTLLAVKRTWWGFRVRATGQNESAARTAGIATARTGFVTMALAGGISGLVGFNEVFLHSFKLVDGYSSGFGFTGLAIALLARGSVPGLLFSALLFGALHKGTLDLDLETEKVTRDLSDVIQALILVALAAQPFISRLLDSRRKATGKAAA